MNDQHRPYPQGSGVVRCSCGWESTHYAHDDDMWAAFDNHLIWAAKQEK